MMVTVIGDPPLLAEEVGACAKNAKHRNNTNKTKPAISPLFISPFPHPIQYRASALQTHTSVISASAVTTL
jgi:hypothetical protein